jgi:hypothetical protein
VTLRVPGGRRVELDVAAPQAGAAVALAVRLGGERARFDGAQVAATLGFDLCDRDGVVTGRIEPLEGVPVADGRSSAGLVRAVRVVPCG